METMSKTTPSEDQVDIFGGNQAATLVASVVLAAALLFGTIYTGGGGDDDAGRKQKVRLLHLPKCIYTYMCDLTGRIWGGGRRLGAWPPQ
jgi:hypothetical protein